MKKVFVIFLMFLFLNVQASAECNRFGVNFEFLYLYPAIEQDAFVIVGDSEATIRLVNGDRISNQPGFNPGGRIRGFYCCNPTWELSGSFFYFSAKNSRSVSATNGILFPTIIGQDGLRNSTASAEADFRFYGGDIAFGYTLTTCPYKFIFHAGIHLASIRVKNDYEFEGITVQSGIFDHFTVRTQSRIWGLGPELGLDFENIMCFCRNLSFKGSIYSGLLALQTNSLFSGQQFFSPDHQTIETDNDVLWKVKPFIHMDLGLNYRYDICCTGLVLSTGYTFFWYHDAVNTVSYFDFFDSPQSNDFFQDFMLHGPYLSLRLEY
jgi:hypothetical protein